MVVVIVVCRQTPGGWKGENKTVYNETDSPVLSPTSNHFYIRKFRESYCPRTIHLITDCPSNVRCEWDNIFDVTLKIVGNFF